VARPSDPKDPALARAIRELRQDRGMTLEGLAHAAGITTTTLVRIEGQQTNPTWTTVRRLAGALNTTMRELGQRVDVGD
jgi:DNA-binding XRE family transcriptional regulator